MINLISAGRSVGQQLVEFKSESALIGGPNRSFWLEISKVSTSVRWNSIYFMIIVVAIGWSTQLTTGTKGLQSSPFGSDRRDWLLSLKSIVCVLNWRSESRPSWMEILPIGGKRWQVYSFHLVSSRFEVGGQSNLTYFFLIYITELSWQVETTLE